MGGNISKCVKSFPTRMSKKMVESNNGKNGLGTRNHNDVVFIILGQMVEHKFFIVWFGRRRSYYISWEEFSYCNLHDFVPSFRKDS